MELTVIDNKGKESGRLTVDEAALSTKASKSLLHEFVVAYRANQRAGTHETLTRSFVSGGGIKPWKQKGTGRARSGSTRSPLWRHGGIIFGPHSRDYSQNLPKKKKKVAFKLAVESLFKEDRLQIVEPIKISEPKTKLVAEIYKKWKTPTDSFYIVEKIDGQLNRAARNIENVTLKDVESLNVYDCLRARKIYITAKAMESLSARLAQSEESK